MNNFFNMVLERFRGFLRTMWDVVKTPFCKDVISNEPVQVELDWPDYENPEQAAMLSLAAQLEAETYSCSVNSPTVITVPYNYSFETTAFPFEEKPKKKKRKSSKTKSKKTTKKSKGKRK